MYKFSPTSDIPELKYINDNEDVIIIEPLKKKSNTYLIQYSLHWKDNNIPYLTKKLDININDLRRLLIRAGVLNVNEIIKI